MPSCPLPRFRERIQFEIAVRTRGSASMRQGCWSHTPRVNVRQVVSRRAMRATGARHPTKTPVGQSPHTRNDWFRTCFDTFRVFSECPTYVRQSRRRTTFGLVSFTGYSAVRSRRDSIPRRKQLLHNPNDGTVTQITRVLLVANMQSVVIAAVIVTLAPLLSVDGLPTIRDVQRSVPARTTVARIR